MSKRKKKAAPTPRGISLRPVPPGTYKAVCTLVDIEGDGELVDHENFIAHTGTKGFKIFLEILEPSKRKDPVSGKTVRTVGRIIGHVFWDTRPNRKYIKRNVRTIIGRQLKSMSELKRIVWVGKTCEIVVGDHNFRNVRRSCVNVFSSWDGRSSSPARAKSSSSMNSPAARPAVTAVPKTR